MIKEVQQHLTKIVGQKCWEATNVITGTLRLYFGGVLLIKLFDGDIAAFGEGDVLIWGDWKLYDDNNVICHSGSDDEEILRHVSALIGDTCTSFNIVSADCWDADIRFLSGKSLCISGENYDIEDAEHHIWDMAFMDIVFYFGPGNRIEEGKKIGILPYSPFPPDRLPHIDIEDQIKAMKQKIPYDELLNIAKSIMSSNKQSPCPEDLSSE